MQRLFLCVVHSIHLVRNLSSHNALALESDDKPFSNTVVTAAKTTLSTAACHDSSD